MCNWVICVDKREINVFEGFCELFHSIMAFQGVGRGWLVGGKLELKLNDGNTLSLAIICGQMKT